MNTARDTFATLQATRGWRADAVHYRGGFGPGWYVALRDGAGRRVAEGEGDSESDALADALAHAPLDVALAA